GFKIQGRDLQIGFEVVKNHQIMAQDRCGSGQGAGGGKLGFVLVGDRFVILLFFIPAQAGIQ
ncbi:hypothetical protein ACFLXY_10290, partial [Chloroflexota bacterium]